MVDSLKILAGRAPIPVQIFCNERMGNKKKKKKKKKGMKRLKYQKKKKEGKEFESFQTQSSSNHG